jgi:hypothetical protein
MAVSRNLATVQPDIFAGGGIMASTYGATSETAAFEQGILPLMETVLPGKRDAVIGFRADPQLQATSKIIGRPIDRRGTRGVPAFRSRKQVCRHS